MPFQFRCPNGHLLEAEDHDVGQIVNCPVCVTAMAIPPNPAGPPVAMPVSPAAPVAAPGPIATGGYEMGGVAESEPEVLAEEVEVFPDVTGETELADDQVTVDTGEESDQESDVPDFDSDNANQDELHIACPNGHVLAVTRDLLYEEAICPHCNESFELLEQNSVEAKQKRALQAEKRAEKAERVFLYWGIGIAVLVVAGIIGLSIAYAS